VTAWFLEDGTDRVFQNVCKQLPTNTS
jgi:hypothetical protein